jgi:hypothetical protein
MPSNNRFNLEDVIEASQNQQVVVYTAAPLPLEGKLTLSNDKLIRLTVLPATGNPLYIYINIKDIISIASPVSVP